MAALPDRWYFTKEQIRNSPSVRDGIDHGKELGYRQQCANLMQDMGQRLQVAQLVINTSIVYMHRFYMFHSFKNYHRNVMAPCFLFLSAKVEEQPRKLEHVLRVAHTCLKGDKDEPSLDPKSNEYMKLSQDLINNESVVLQTLGFELSVEHPHTYVVKCAQLVKASKDLAQTSYFLATNSLHLTTFCIQYKPTVVACICIYVSCKWANWEIMESQDKKNWWEYIDNSVTPELLEDLSSHFIKILDNSQTRLKKRIASGPLVYKGGVLQQKKHKEEGKPDDTARKHHNGNMEGQRVGSSEHSRISRPPQDMQSVEDAKASHSVSRAKINLSSAGSASLDSKDSRRSSEPGSASSLRHSEQASHYAKRATEHMKGHRIAHPKPESEDLRVNSISHHAEKVSGQREEPSEKSIDHTNKASLDTKEKHTYLAQHQGKLVDSVPKMPMSSSQSSTAPTLKHSSTMDAHLRHPSPMKRPRTEGESQAGPTESRTSVDAHTKHGHVKSDPDGKRPSNHHLYKHKHAKPSSHHRHDTKPSLSDSDKMKHVQYSTSHKGSTHKHLYTARDSSSASTRPGSMPKHSSHTVPTANRPLPQTSKSPILAKSVAKKPKLDSSDSLLPPPPPPPSFPHAILNNTTGKGDSSVMKSLPGTQGQSTSSSNPSMGNSLNNVPSQYRDFFMGGLPEIPLTDLLPPPPPPSASALNATPASPPPPPPPPRS